LLDAWAFLCSSIPIAYVVGNYGIKAGDRARAKRLGNDSLNEPGARDNIGYHPSTVEKSGGGV